MTAVLTPKPLRQCPWCKQMTLPKGKKYCDTCRPKRKQFAWKIRQQRTFAKRKAGLELNPKHKAKGEKRIVQPRVYRATMGSSRSRTP